MQFTQRKRVGIFLIVGVALLSLGAWRMFFMSLAVPGVLDIWQPIVWFLFVMAAFFLGAVVWSSEKTMQASGAIAVFLPGVLFVRDPEYVVALVLAMGLAYWGMQATTRELRERVRFHFFKTVRAGQLLFVIGAALALASGYYVFLERTPWENLVLRFRIGEETTNVILRTAGIINPELASLSEEGTTVNEFLLSFKQEENQILSVLDPEQRTVAQELLLASGREQIATLAGRPVNGDEKMSDVLSSALERKLIALFRGEQAMTRVAPQAIPFFLSLLLFLTLMTFLSLVGTVCATVAFLLFRGMLFARWLRLEKVPTEQDRLSE